jgi:hypothetical protein
MLRSRYCGLPMVLLCVSVSIGAQVAQPTPDPAAAVDTSRSGRPADRAGLLAAWEREVARTAKLERIGPDRYTIAADEIGYSGPLSIDTVLIREQPAAGAGVSHFGVVDFTLDELPAARANSHAVMVWRGGLQQFHFDIARGWRSQREFAQEMERQFDSSGAGLLAAAGGSGLIFLLPLAILALFVWLSIRNSRRATALFDDTRVLNDQARADLERNRAIQDEQMQLLRRSIAVNEDSNRLLREIAEALRAPR